MGFGTNYLGNLVASETPDPGPAPGQPPLVYLAVDTDGASWANTEQARKVLADYQAYANSGRPSIWRELLWSTATGIAATQNPLTNFGELAIIMAGGTSQADFKDPGAISTAYNGRCCQLTVGSAATNFNALVSSSKFAGFANPANLSVCAEIDVAMSASGLTNTNTTVGFGDAASVVFGSNNLFTFTHNPFIGTHWLCSVASTGGGTAVSVAAGGGFDPVALTFQHLKLEFFGSATARGVANGSAYAKFSINDTLITSQNLAANQVPAANCAFGAGGVFFNTGTGLVDVGQWTVQWSRF